MEIDVVIPSYNDIRVLEALESIYSADLRGVELTVILQVGNSNAQIVDLIKRRFPMAEVCVDPDENIFDAINLGLNKCHGDYVLTIGSDDRISEPAIFQCVKAMKENAIDFFFVGLEYTSESWVPLRRWPAREISRRDYRLGRQYAHFGFFCKPAIYREIGFFNANNSVNADYEFFWQLAKYSELRSCRQGKVKEYCVQMKIGGNSSSGVISILSHNFRILKFALREAPTLIPGILIFKWFYKAAEYIRSKRL